MASKLTAAESREKNRQKAGVSQSKAAAHLFMSTVNFHRLTERGVITKATTGKGYDLDKVREQYILHLRGVAGGRGGKTADGIDPASEKARKDKEMADRVALQNAQTRGELAPVSEFQSIITDAFVRFRSRLLSMPSKLAPRLEGADRVEIREIIKKETEAALEEIRTTKYVAKTTKFMQESQIPDVNYDDEDEAEE